jgi:hypothetical protein
MRWRAWRGTSPAEMHGRRPRPRGKKGGGWGHGRWDVSVVEAAARWEGEGKQRREQKWTRKLWLDRWSLCFGCIASVSSLIFLTL